MHLGNRLFAQHHVQYLEEYRSCVVKSLISGTAVARVLFVTIAFRVGIDVPMAEGVNHILWEDFFQGTGRAGRNGNHVVSIPFFQFI